MNFHAKVIDFSKQFQYTFINLLFYRKPTESQKVFCPALTKAVLNQIKKLDEITLHNNEERFKVHFCPFCVDCSKDVLLSRL